MKLEKRGLTTYINGIRVKLEEQGSGTEYSVYSTKNDDITEMIKLIKLRNIQEYFPLENYGKSLEILINLLNNAELTSTLQYSRPLNLITDKSGKTIGYTQNKIKNSIDFETFIKTRATIDGVISIVIKILEVIQELSTLGIVNIDPFIYNFLIDKETLIPYLIDFGKHILIYDKDYNEVIPITGTKFEEALQISIRNILLPLLQFLEHYMLQNMNLDEIAYYENLNDEEQLNKLLEYFCVPKNEREQFCNMFFNSTMDIEIIINIIKQIRVLPKPEYINERKVN